MEKFNGFIDVHLHAYLFPYPPQDGHTQFCTVDQVLRRYDELGIERGIIHPLIGPEVYIPQSNAEVLEICRLHPDRFIPFFNIDPRGIRNREDTDFSPWIDWFLEHGCKGVGEFMPNMYFDDPRVLNLFSQLNARNMVLTFDCAPEIGDNYGLVDEAGLGKLDRCLTLFPHLTILGHGPCFWMEIGPLEDDPLHRTNRYPKTPIQEPGAVVKLMQKHPNLWGDLSAGSGYWAMARDRKFAAWFLNEFQDRLCFGTDLCYADQEIPQVNFLLALKEDGLISDGCFRKIARENAIRLFDL